MEEMRTEWVIGVYKGKRAENIKAHADTGIGYFIRSEGGRGATYEVEVAFRRAIDDARPEWLTPASSIQAEKLEVMRKKRQSIVDRS